MRRSGYALGVLLILVVAVIWSASSVLVQAIFTSASFRKPFFLTWVANSLFMVTLPIRLAVLGIRRAAHPAPHTETDDALALVVPQAAGLAAVRQAARSALLVAPVWFAANCTYNYSMSMTSISSSTVISSSSAAFTLLLSAMWLRERVTGLKLLGVALCWLGNGLTAIDDDAASAHNASGIPGAANASGSGGDEHGATFRGDVICLLSAVLYALYTVMIRKLEPPDLSLFFGFLGISTFVLFGPAVVVLHLTGAESLATLTPAVFSLILLKGLVDNVLSDYLWAAAVLLTSPSVATIGMSLTVPLAMISDVALPREWLVDPASPTIFSVCAALAVVAGFVAITAAGDGSDAGSDDERGDACGAALRAPLLRWRRSAAGERLRDEPATPADVGASSYAAGRGQSAGATVT